MQENPPLRPRAQPNLPIHVDVLADDRRKRCLLPDGEIAIWLTFKKLWGNIIEQQRFLEIFPLDNRAAQPSQPADSNGIPFAALDPTIAHGPGFNAGIIEILGVD